MTIKKKQNDDNGGVGNEANKSDYGSEENDNDDSDNDVDDGF